MCYFLEITKTKNSIEHFIDKSKFDGKYTFDWYNLFPADAFYNSKLSKNNSYLESYWLEIRDYTKNPNLYFGYEINEQNKSINIISLNPINLKTQFFIDTFKLNSYVVKNNETIARIRYKVYHANLHSYHFMEDSQITFPSMFNYFNNQQP